MTVDPITLEVIRNGFVAAADEMRLNLTRTSYNPIIYEVLDFSLGLFDADGDIVAQAAGLPIFLGNLGEAIKTVIRDIGRDNFRPGDCYLINDTYTTGTHLNDVTVISPVFAGDLLVGFTASRAHWLDMGGKSPGGSVDSTDVYQEGLRLRSVQLYDAGVLNESVMRIIRDNVRNPDAQIGDLRAQIAAGRTGEARFAGLVDRFGVDTVLEAVRLIKEHGEQVARQAVQAMPDGEYEAEGWLDDDGVTTDPRKVKARVIIKGDAMTIDLTGSSPQADGPINCGYAATVSGCRVAFKCITSPFAQVNEGCFAPLEVVVPEDSMFNARLPAPAFLYGVSLILLCDIILKALAPALPDQIPAAHYGDMSGFMIFGTDPDTGELFIQQEPEAGGWGACPDRDGENVMIFIADGDTRNVPCEVIENRFPLRLERYEVRENSGGPGRFRGGCGHYRDYRLLAPSGFMMGIMDRKVCRPWGLFGGRPGLHSVMVVNPVSADEREFMKITGHPLAEDDLVSVRTGGGGGYGDPLERDPERVRLDVIQGYVTADRTEPDYGVVLTDSGEVNEAATRNLRERMRTDGGGA